jgi:hypothetical protein
MDIFRAVAQDENRSAALRGCAMFRVVQTVDQMTSMPDNSQIPLGIPFKQSSVLLTCQGPLGQIRFETDQEISQGPHILCLRLGGLP